MKKHFLLLLLVLGYTFGNGQSTNWKQIKTPNKSSVKLLYQASDGTLFGNLTETDKLVVSLDNGGNWITSDNIKATQYYYGNNNQFIENSNGIVHYYNDNKVYKFDKVNIKFTLFINLDNYNYVKDMAYLINGDLVIGTNDELLLYAESGVLKKKHEWWTHSVTFLVADDANGKNYVTNSLGASYSILEFKSDLSFVGNKKPIEYTSAITRIGDKIFSENRYSDDGGITWNLIPGLTSNYIEKIIEGHNNKIYFITGSKIFVSENGGMTTTLMPLNFEYVRLVSSSDDNILIVGSENGSNCNPEIFVSLDSGNNFTKIKNDIGTDYARQIIPGINENIFSFSCEFQQSIDGIQAWKEVKLQNQFGFNDRMENIIHLSNHEIIASFDFYDLYKSTDQGLTWKSLNNHLYFSVFDKFITEKNGILSYLEFDSLAISKDFGVTWQKKGISENVSFYLDYKFDFSESDGIYYYDEFEFNSLVKYDVNSQVITPIVYNSEPDGYSLDFATSFDGSSLYILTSNWSDKKLKIQTSNDGGQTFRTDEIGIINQNQGFKLKTDHLGNIYVYSESLVLMSSDQGASWQNITPDFPELVAINDLKVSYDNYIYLATHGKGILKYNVQLSEPKILTVSLYDDVNKNCQQDVNEGALNYGKIVVNDNYVKAVDANGEATFYVIKEQNTVSVQFNDKIYDYCESSYDVDMSTGINSISIPLKSKKYCADLVTSISTPFLRRCFDNTYYGQVCNEGNIDAEETEVKIILDDYFDLIQANLPQLSHVGNELTLDAGTIKPGECKNLNFTINLSCDATLGQEHCVIIDSESRSQSCNSIETRTEYTECQDNIGSFDPNDKAIFVNGVRNQTYLEPGDKLEYMIRFQNTGTDTAFTVKIQDPISTKFDVASMRPVASSHDYIWSVDNGTLNVVFNQIMLVDSFKNEPASHGFIKFEITLDEKTMLYEEVSNIAGIYFDFNEPIITNEVVTPVGKPVFTNDWSVSPFFIYPNPTTDFLSLGINDVKFNAGKVNIFDQKGGKLLTTDFNIGLSNRINVSHLPSGFYIIQVVNNKSEFKTKFVKL